MAKGRSIFLLSLVTLWTAMPVLACLPRPAMTQAEMDCCKKMAGDCQMGSGHHSCCKAEVRRPSNFLKVSSQSVPVPVHSAVIVLVLAVADYAGGHSPQLATSVHSPPESPPISTTILRI